MLARPGQTIEQHTHECTVGASLNASRIGLARTAALIGAFHDFGKWSDAFYDYMEAIASGKIVLGRAPSIILRQEHNIYGVISQMDGKQ